MKSQDEYRNRLVSLMCLVLCFGLSGCWFKKNTQNYSNPNDASAESVVTVLTYSSLGSNSGLLNQIKNQLWEQSHCQLQIETVPGASQMVSYVKDRRQNTAKPLDWVLGVDYFLYDQMSDQFEDTENFKKLRTSLTNQIKTSLLQNPMVLELLKQPGFIPFEYGALTFIYHKSSLAKLKLLPPQEFQDLWNSRYRHQFILQDPRLSSPGLYFFMSLPIKLSLLDLSKNWRILAQSWEPSYQFFLKGEAPMVWSYLSSIAYHESKGEGANYDFVDFKEGLPLQVEGLVKLKTATFRRCDEEFAKWLLSETVQNLIPEKQFMFPVIKAAVVPTSFKRVADFSHFNHQKKTGKDVQDLLNRFAKEVQGDHW